VELSYLVFSIKATLFHIEIVPLSDELILNLCSALKGFNTIRQGEALSQKKSE